jgi:hypothetical protein
MPSIVNSPKPGGPSRAKSTPAGIAGNVSRDGVPMRQWSARSYSGRDGRAASSLGDQYGRGSPSTTHATELTNHVETTHASGQHGAPSMTTRTARAVQDPTPVRNRRP